jgi:hypothetical protein
LQVRFQPPPVFQLVSLITYPKYKEGSSATSVVKILMV